MIGEKALNDYFKSQEKEDVEVKEEKKVDFNDVYELMSKVYEMLSSMVDTETVDETETETETVEEVEEKEEEAE